MNLMALAFIAARRSDDSHVALLIIGGITALASSSEVFSEPRTGPCPDDAQASAIVGANNRGAKSSKVPDAATSSAERHYSVSQIAKFFKPPKTPEELWRNIRVALDHDSIKQPEFFDEAVLLKFFNASAVKWEADSTQDSAHGQVFITSGRLSPMIVDVTYRYWTVAAFTTQWGSVAAHTQYLGYFDAPILPTSGSKVSAVLDTFGPASGEELDTGWATDGASVAVTSKGWMDYDFNGNRYDYGAYGKDTKIAKFHVKEGSRPTPEVVAAWRNRQHILCRDNELSHFFVSDTGW